MKTKNFIYHKKAFLIFFGIFFLIATVFLLTTSLIRHVDGTDGKISRLTKKQRDSLILISNFPALIRDSIVEMQSHITGIPILLTEPKSEREKNTWIRHFPEPQDKGYLLLSALDPEKKKATIRLLKIADGTTLTFWNPDWDNIYKKIGKNSNAPLGSKFKLHAYHPLLLEDGNLIFHTDDPSGVLIKLNSCDNKPLWMLTENYAHHSVETSLSGNFWIGSTTNNGIPENPWIQSQIRDDSVALVSKDGVVLKNYSLSRILIDNGLSWLFLGSGAKINGDPFHLNQITEAKIDSIFWKKGDLLISLRHLSTILIWRPSTNKVIWYKTGPWMGQHDAQFIDDHRISIFDNNSIYYAPREFGFLKNTDINRVIVFDFHKNETSQPYASLLADSRPITHNQGRARVLPDGGLFVEETNGGRHLRYTKNKLLWSRVNDYDDKRIGLVFWSRYMTAEEVEKPLKALTEKGCAFPQ